jgi:uncharacterized protein (DUF1810 family)
MSNPHETFWQSFLSTVSGKRLSDRQKLYMNFCLMVVAGSRIHGPLGSQPAVTGLKEAEAYQQTSASNCLRVRFSVHFLR